VQALSQIFGDDLGRIPVSAIKSMLGHCMGAASALEAIAIIMTIDRQMIPPTINTTEVDPEFPVAVDVNPGTARKLVVRNVLSNAFGFGGNICSIVLGTYHPN
jgi:3-oxoacyl-[acyl-carrier-protein] synthase II